MNWYVSLLVICFLAIVVWLAMRGGGGGGLAVGVNKI